MTIAFILIWLTIGAVTATARIVNIKTVKNGLINAWGGLLPVGYYHLVFTIPHQLKPLCQQNKKVMYGILFTTASQMLLELSKDARHLGADTGLITVLHTCGQNTMGPPHLHCIMPAGGISFDKSHWLHTRKSKDFFIHY